MGEVEWLLVVGYMMDLSDSGGEWRSPLYDREFWSGSIH